MIEEATAREQILAATQPLPAISLPLAQALGHYSAGRLLATVALPPHANSAMDGYAIHSADCGKAGCLLHITAEQPAGPDLGHRLTPGQAIRVFTGAPLPQETGAVVMQEDTQRDGLILTILEAAQPGEFIRLAASDLCPGQQLWSPGTRLNALHLSLAASQGLTHISVHPSPCIGILTTGSELRQPGSPLQSGEIYNSNEMLLASQVRSAFPHAAVEIATLHVRDDLAATQAALQQLSQQCHVILIAGGVSVGDHDHVKPALTALGATQHFWKVKIKPGKPFLHSTLGSTACYGLPGNPVSAYVTAFALVLPALRRLAGCPAGDCFPVGQPVSLAASLENTDQRPTYFRGTYHPATHQFSPQGLQESHALATLARSNMLVRIPSQTLCAAGTQVVGWHIT